MQNNLDLVQIIKPVISGLGYNFYGLEYIANKNSPTVCIYIDSSSGVSVDDCQKVSYQVAQVLSVEDNASQYNLEVSSPGIERKLFTIEQCNSQVGKTIKITTAVPIEKQRNFTGILQQVVGEQLYLAVEGGEKKVFDFTNINSAQVVAEW